MYGAVRIGQANEYSPSRFCDQSFEFIRSRFESLLVHTDCRAKYTHTCTCVSRAYTKSGGKTRRLCFHFSSSSLHFCPPLFNRLFFVLHTLELCERHKYIYIYMEKYFEEEFLIVGNIVQLLVSLFHAFKRNLLCFGINRWINHLEMRLLNRHWLVISYNYILELFLTSKTFLKFRKDTIYHSISFGKTKDRCLERILIASRIFFEEQDDSLKNRGQDERSLKVFTSDPPSNGKVWKYLSLSLFSSLLLSLSRSLAEENKRRPTLEKGWLTQFLERSLIRTSLKISPLGLLLNFYSYRFKARSEIYRANICLIFKMHRASPRRFIITDSNEIPSQWKGKEAYPPFGSG